MRGGAEAAGLAVMWAGNLLLALLTLHAFRQWARH